MQVFGVYVIAILKHRVVRSKQVVVEGKYFHGGVLRMSSGVSQPVERSRSVVWWYGSGRYLTRLVSFGP